MNQLPPSPHHESLFEAISAGEKKKIPLVAAMSRTRVEKGNVAQFILAMNELNAPLSSELITQTWPSLDIECRMTVIREWLVGKDKEPQAGAYHTLSARLLMVDQDSSMMLLDNVVKLTSSSSVCLKRVVSATKAEWIGTTLEQARFRRLDPLLLKSASRLKLLDWLCDACAADVNPLDNEKRKAELQKQSKERTELVAEWLANLSVETLPETTALVVSRCLARLRPATRATVPLTAVQSSPEPSSAAVVVSVQPSPTIPSPPGPLSKPVPFKSATGSAVDESNEMFREVFNTIKNLFQKATQRHAKEIEAAISNAAALRAALERSERDLANFREANTRNSKQLLELEESNRALRALKEETDTALSVSTEKLTSTLAQLESERQEKQSARQESHEAVARETERERERLLVQLGQRIANIIESYREIRSRGPLPEGTPAMIGSMMDELVSRLEAAGVRLNRA